MKRRDFLFTSLAFGTIAALGISSTKRRQLAITMDDFNWEKGVHFTPAKRNENILSALKDGNLRIALFVCGRFLQKTEGKTLLKKWDEGGHWIANHTYNHRNCNDVSTDEFCADILKNETVLKDYHHFKRWFRFPFLKEGNTVDRRDTIRSFLKEHGYRNGHVTIDASDWYIHSRLQERLLKEPKADLIPYRDYYLKHLSDRAEYYDRLSVKVLGRSVKHTLLLHHNELNAFFLSDVLQMFRKKDWELIDASEAFLDPVFLENPNTIPAGESLLWSLAKQAGKLDANARYPAEDSEYEKEAMDRLGL